MSTRSAGFTVIEVLIAIIMLSIGVLALSSGSGSVTRMISSGQNKTNAYTQAVSRLDSLRAQARATNCGISGGSWTGPYGVSGAWTVTSVTSGRELRVIAQYRNGPFLKADTIFATVYCP